MLTEPIARTPSRGRGAGPVLLLQGLGVNRRRPDLAGLAGETNPERFVWQILPHAARSFAASIVMLPPDHARATAVAYLYCRMLDTYEDLWPDPETRGAELCRFADRFEADTGEMPAPTPIPPALARDARDEIHLLLVARCEHVDAVFATLPKDVRVQIGALVRSMSEGMIWSSAAFDEQGGVLLDTDQLTRYCRNVIGHPVHFVIGQVGGRRFTDGAKEDAFLVSEMVQLANVTRDIEADLARGVGYHPALKPYLGHSGEDPSGVVAEVRREYVALALARAGAYRRLFEALDLGRTATVRTAAVLMLLFTDLHYRGCAARTGDTTWPGPRGRFEVVARSLPALVSPRWAARTLESVERNLLGAAGRLAAAGPGSRP